MIHLALRFDDPSATSNHALESAIFEAIESRAVPITVAAIPFRRQGEEYVPLSAANAAHLIDAHRNGLIEIAQHGHSHEKNGVTNTGQSSEFFGLPAREQYDLVAQGRALLQGLIGCEVRGFVPPWNTADAATITALEDLEFAYISAGSEVVDTATALRSLPRTCQLTHLREAVAQARRYSWLNPVLIAVFHHYDFHESNSGASGISLRDFEITVDWIARQPDVKAYTLSALVDEKRLQARLGALQTLSRYTPWAIRRHLPTHFLIPLPQPISFLH